MQHSPTEAVPPKNTGGALRARFIAAVEESLRNYNGYAQSQQRSTPEVVDAQRNLLNPEAPFGVNAPVGFLH